MEEISRYEGFWTNDRMNGYGHEIWKDGSEFWGYFEDSNKVGLG